MNKIKTLLLACSLLPLAYSCSGDPDTHELIPVEQRFILYADQTVDSLRFYTFDSWTATRISTFPTTTRSVTSAASF